MAKKKLTGAALNKALNGLLKAKVAENEAKAQQKKHKAAIVEHADAVRGDSQSSVFETELGKVTVTFPTGKKIDSTRLEKIWSEKDPESRKFLRRDVTISLAHEDYSDAPAKIKRKLDSAIQVVPQSPRVAIKPKAPK